ncbi:MAG: hypothetical protein R3302_01275 [Sulfurimonadaceae bacterium]|nr:hypothetical protein [Sulfurimonadaceae bacterium]
MKTIATLSVSGALLIANLFAADPAASSYKLECSVVEEHDKIIQCTFSSVRLATDRQITFKWKSDTTPQDDRERTFILPAGHGSVYDYRFYYGRAPGLWNVSTVNDNGDVLSETSFTLE